MLNEIYEFFLKVSEMGSISKAADKLYISQPALSQQLKNLEKELDASLFIRSNKGIELTGEGKIVYKYFSMSEKLLQEMKKEIRDKKNNVKYQLPYNRWMIEIQSAGSVWFIFHAIGLDVGCPQIDAKRL